jgi:hypothetical protein
MTIVRGAAAHTDAPQTFRTHARAYDPFAVAGQLIITFSNKPQLQDVTKEVRQVILAPHKQTTREGRTRHDTLTAKGLKPKSDAHELLAVSKKD